MPMPAEEYSPKFGEVTARVGDEPLMMPMRVVPNDEGCELTFIYYRRPGMTDEQFASVVEWVTSDFMALKSLLEFGHSSAV